MYACIYIYILGIRVAVVEAEGGCDGEAMCWGSVAGSAQGAAAGAYI
jgi:hypothetical protein